MESNLGKSSQTFHKIGGIMLFRRRSFPKYPVYSFPSATTESNSHSDDLNLLSQSFSGKTRRGLMFFRKRFSKSEKTKNDRQVDKDVKVCEDEVPLLDYSQLTRKWLSPEREDDLGALQPHHLPSPKLSIIY
jgi:hypothetical protein